MRFHVISLPHTHSTAAYPSCAFTQKVRRFCQMMTTLGHEVFLYSGEENDVPCTEHISCISEKRRSEMVGSKHYTEADWSHPHWSGFLANVIGQMHERTQPQDFICLIGGYAQKPIADAFPAHLSVEFGIGYAGTFAKFRVFESYAWMHMIYGAQSNGNAASADGQWFDAVIPNQVEDGLYGVTGLDDLPHGVKVSADDVMATWGHVGRMPGEIYTDGQKELDTINQRRRALRIANLHNISIGDYALYMGRLIDRKGYRIAQEACEAKGVRLILAGPGEASGYGEFVGEVDAQERARLMAGARCLMVPTQYVEPFGTVHIEAMACGTPIISTDWGVFTETVENGVHGYRCRTFSEFCDAVDDVKRLDRKRIRADAMRRYSMATVGKQYEDYFKRLGKLWGKGWYEHG